MKAIGKAICCATGLMLAAAWATGCSGATTSDVPSTRASAPSSAVSASPAATSTPPAVTVTAGVPYATIPEQSTLAWKTPLMDLYSPEGAEGLPLVVFFHGGGADKSNYGPAAEAIAQRGAVVAVPNWGSVSPAAMGGTVATTPQIVAAMMQHLDGGACAVDYAVAHATEFGADPSRLVLAGNSAGANEASVVALGEKAPFPGCLAPSKGWTARGLMLWEGDWLLEDPEPGWDTFQGKLPSLMAVTTPWQMLDDAKGLPVAFGVTDTSRQSMRRCDATETVDWLAWRDPNGELRRMLTKLGAYQDGCIDIGEESDLMSSAMNEHGLNSSVLDFTDPGSSHMSLTKPDLDLMAQRTLALVGN